MLIDKTTFMSGYSPGNFSIKRQSGFKLRINNHFPFFIDKSKFIARLYWSQLIFSKRIRFNELWLNSYITILVAPAPFVVLLYNILISISQHFRKLWIYNKFSCFINDSIFFSQQDDCFSIIKIFRILILIIYNEFPFRIDISPFTCTICNRTSSFTEISYGRKLWLYFDIPFFVNKTPFQINSVTANTK